MLFVSTTTLVAGWENITDNFIPMTFIPATAMQGYIDALLTAVMMLCAVIILIEAFRRWYKVLAKGEYCVAGQAVYATEGNFSPPEYGCC